MSIRTSSFFVFLVLTSISALASGVDKLTLDDQLKVISSTAFNHELEQNESLIIEVASLSIEDCLKSLILKIKDGYNPDYPGNFDNSFLNRLIIGSDNIDPYYDRNNHAHRKIELVLENNDGRNGSILCDVRLSSNHKFVGVNFLQQFIGYELIQPRFYLLDQKGNILVEPPTEELQNRNNVTELNSEFPGVHWYPGAKVDKNPVEYVSISNDGHLFLSHG